MIWQREEAQWPNLAAKRPIEDNFISSPVSKQHIFSNSAGDRGYDRTKYNKNVHFWLLKDN